MNGDEGRTADEGAAPDDSSQAGIEQAEGAGTGIEHAEAAQHEAGEQAAEDAAAAAEDSGATPPPPTGPPVLGTPQHGGPEYGAPQAGPAGVAGPSPARAAAPLFLAGVAVAIGVSIAGVMVLNSRGGGVLWWGGYFVTAGLWRAAWRRYQDARAATGTGLSGLATGAAAIGVLVSLGAAAVFGLAWFQDKTAPALAETVGSCWAVENDQAFLVPCDDPDALYTALEEVSTDADCPATSIGSVETATAGRYLCLGLR